MQVIFWLSPKELSPQVEVSERNLIFVGYLEGDFVFGRRICGYIMFFGELIIPLNVFKSFSNLF
mgnify:CR=1